MRNFFSDDKHRFELEINWLILNEKQINMKSNIQFYLFTIVLLQPYLIFSFGKFANPKQPKVLSPNEVKRILEVVTQYLQEKHLQDKTSFNDYFVAKLFYIVLQQMRTKKIETPPPPSFWYSREGRWWGEGGVLFLQNTIFK